MYRLLPLLLLIASPGRTDSEWPQWRGPSRDGTATAASLPTKLPEALPAPVWTARVGAGYSSPVIGSGRLYVMGSDSARQEAVYCFDATTGKELWKHAYPTTYEPPDPRSGTFPKSTPTLDRDRVYTLGLGGMFHCLDAATGRVLWKRDFLSEFWGVERDTDEVDSWFPPCGMAASPIADGDQVIVPVGGKKAGAFAGFDRETGKLLWHALPERSSYASPLIVTLAGVRQIVGFTGLRMAGLDAASRELLWDYPFPCMFEQTIITPVVHKDLVIVSGEQKPTVALRILREDGRIVRKQAWQNPDLKAYMTCPVIVNGHLYGYDSVSRRVVCVDVADGATKWTSERIAGHVTMLAVGERILVQSSRGEMIVMKANPAQFEELGRWKLSEEGETWACPAIVDSRLYVKDRERVLCFDLARQAPAAR